MSRQDYGNPWRYRARSVSFHGKERYAIANSIDKYLSGRQHGNSAE